MEWINHAFLHLCFFNNIYVDVHDGHSIIQMSLRRVLLSAYKKKQIPSNSAWLSKCIMMNDEAKYFFLSQSLFKQNFQKECTVKRVSLFLLGS